MMTDKTRQFPKPFFLPYVILGYNAVYPQVFNPRVILRNDLVTKGLIDQMDGSREGKDVDAWLQQAMNIPPDQHPVPRNIMEETWVQQNLDDNTYQQSDAGKILADNNLWSGWAPNMEMLIQHSYYDDCVPYANSEKAYNEFIKTDPTSKNRLSFWYIPIINWPQLNHVQAAVVAIPIAITWFGDK
ncbi:MAG: hypothetical protein HQK60_01400 [Deltaproteobacteria bacterium]|nr:hypothetical protein [Deltaproteobacteria bacterium]